MSFSIVNYGPKSLLRLSALGGVLMTSAVALAGPAFAQTSPDLSATIQGLQQQIGDLQSQLNNLKLAKDTQPTQAAASASGIDSVLQNHGIKLTVGGFVEAASIFRTRNETADIGSSWSGIPLPNTSAYHTNEFRGSARQSRLSLLAEGDVDPNTTLTAYFESDFLGVGTTSNSNESNSYVPRLRQAYLTLDKKDYGFHLLAGQSWSLLTMDRVGITPRQEDVPLTIDAQYVPGFTWARQWQVRAVQDIGSWTHLGLSIEEPQAVVSAGANTATVPVFNASGGSLLNSTTTYSTDVAPDVVAKIAFDPGWGHYEVYGVGRIFQSRLAGQNNDVLAGGGGADALLPLIPGKLELKLSGMVGDGIGRYGSAQLPDATITPRGQISPISEVQLLAGLVGHPTDKLDLYSYAGVEQAGRDSFTLNGKGYGYGSPLYINSGCETEGATNCVGNTSGVWQVTVGGWWKVLKGSFGMMEVGVQDSYTKRDTFVGIGGRPSADENVFMTSIRYYPF
jgi:hypothetical protein